MAANDNGLEDGARDLDKMDFHHPYTPYHFQEQFMRAAYQVLERGQGQVGILESPTGTVSPATSLSRFALRLS